MDETIQLSVEFRGEVKKYTFPAPKEGNIMKVTLEFTEDWAVRRPFVIVKREPLPRPPSVTTRESLDADYAELCRGIDEYRERYSRFYSREMAAANNEETLDNQDETPFDLSTSSTTSTTTSLPDAPTSSDTTRKHQERQRRTIRMLKKLTGRPPSPQEAAALQREGRRLRSSTVQDKKNN